MAETVLIIAFFTCSVAIVWFWPGITEADPVKRISFYAAMTILTGALGIYLPDGLALTVCALSFVQMVMDIYETWFKAGRKD